jgi:vacuolar-type H+-ATPase subunit F/Vma7
MTRYLVRPICRPEIALGFSLAGLRPSAVATEEAACRELEVACGDPRVGVVLLEEGFYRTLPDRLSLLLERMARPLVVPFPGPTWFPRPEEAERYVVELLRQVIGYRVRLR